MINYLKNPIASGIAYTALTKYTGIVISLIISSILSRILSPKDFGIVAIASIIIQFLNIFSELGIAPAIIQNKSLTKADLSSIFIFTLWIGVFLSIVFYCSSNSIGLFFSNNQLPKICKILSTSILFSSLNLVPNALILKNKQFKYITKQTLALQLILGSISIYSAYHGWGIYALVINPTMTSFFSFTLNYIKYPQKIRLAFDLKSIKKIASFSIYQFLFNFLNYFSRNLDKLIIGRYINMQELGYYEKSYRLMLLPIQNITNVITPVLQPILSEYDTKRIIDSYIKMIRILGIISFPLTVFLYFSSEDIIIIVFGINWEKSVPIFRILSLSVAGQIILSTSGSIFQSLNKTKLLFYNGLSNTLCTILGLSLSCYIFKSAESVAWSWTITLYINFIISFYILLYKVLKISYLTFLKFLIVPILVSMLSSTCMHYFSELFMSISNDILVLMAKFSVVLLFSLFGLQIDNRYNARKINNYLQQQ